MASFVMDFPKETRLLETQGGPTGVVYGGVVCEPMVLFCEKSARSVTGPRSSGLFLEYHSQPRLRSA